MKTYIFDQSGRCTCAANSELPLDNLEDGLVGVHSESFYNPNAIYYDGEIKFTQPFNVNVSTNLITGIPAGTDAFIDGNRQVVDDGSLELEVAFNSTVHVVLIHPHYQTIGLEVTCEV